MAEPVDTAAGEEGSKCTDTLTLKEIIANEYKDAQRANDIYSKLVEMEIANIQTLILIDEADLNDLCGELKLKFNEKIKFKSLMRKQKKLHEPKQLSYIVPISKHEQSQINKIDIALKTADSIQHLFETHFNEIEQHTTTTKSKVNQKFDIIFKSLKTRQNTILNKIDEWKLKKLEAINSETSNIIKYSDGLKQTKKEIYSLLSKGAAVIDDEREKEIEQIAQKVINDNKYYNTFDGVKALEKYINNNTKLLDIAWSETISISKLNEFGEINIDKLNTNYCIPSILLSDIENIEKDEKGYKVRLKWKMRSVKQNNNDNDDDEKGNDLQFIVECMECDSFNDNEKKEIDLDDEKGNWNILKKLKLKPTANEFREDFQKLFSYGKLYKYRIQSIISKPIGLKITSNIKTFILQNKVNIDLQNQKQITFSIHSNNGYLGNEANYKPEHMLKQDDNRYYTKNNAIRGSWIIFQSNNNENYYPTKVEARGWNGTGTAKEFNVWIGNSDQNMWIKCNNEMLTAEKKEGFQTFNLDIYNNNNVDNEVNNKWKNMQENRYNQYKLEMISSYGYTSAGFYEFKMFGVAYN